MKDKLLSKKGQSTVEAAFVLPILMVLILLLVQPGIYLYDMIVMKSAASEGCRLLALKSCSDEQFEDYIRRRLSAIPQTDVFHVHDEGCAYKISSSTDDSGKVCVVISNELTPLPLLNVFAKPLGCLNAAGNLDIEVKSEAFMQPTWALEEKS